MRPKETSETQKLGFRSSNELVSIASSFSKEIRGFEYCGSIRGKDGIVSHAVTFSPLEIKQLTFFKERGFSGFINGRPTVILFEGRDEAMNEEGVLNTVCYLQENLERNLRIKDTEKILKEAVITKADREFDNHAVSIGLLYDYAFENGDIVWFWNYAISGEGGVFILSNLTKEGEHSLRLARGKKTNDDREPFIGIEMSRKNDLFVLGSSGLIRGYDDFGSKITEIISGEFAKWGFVHDCLFGGPIESIRLRMEAVARRSRVNISMGMIGRRD